MIFTSPNDKRFRFQLIDSGYKILRETAEQIVWAGEHLPMLQGVTEVPA